MSDFRKYISSIGIISAIIIVITAIMAVAVMKKPAVIIISVIAVMIILIALLSASTVITYLTVADRKVPEFLMKINLGLVKAVFPLITVMADISGIDKAGIRRIFIKLNNRYIKSLKFSFDGEDILVLMPHCIQLHSCRFRVTSTIENCARCGLCNISELAQLGDEEGVKIFVATGGTLARKIIVDTRPKAVIAVACERDLTSGVREVRKIPVYGVFNERPNGPCFDTRVNIDDVRNAVRFFKGNL